MISVKCSVTSSARSSLSLWRIESSKGMIGPIKKDLVEGAIDKPHAGSCFHYTSFSNIQYKEEVVISRSGNMHRQVWLRFQTLEVTRVEMFLIKLC